MIIKAEQKFIRISPRKVRNVVSGIKHLSPSQALLQLQFSDAKSALVVSKVIKQALGNAKDNQLDPNQLVFDQIQVNPGPTFKRWQPVSRGRAHPILKRTSHIKITLKSKSPLTPTPVSNKSQAKISPSTQTTSKPSTSKPKPAKTKQKE